MNSLFQRISQSPSADHWRRFRTSSEDFARFLLTVRALGYTVSNGSDALTLIEDGDQILCAAESSDYSPSPFHILQDPYSISFTDCGDAIAEFRHWDGSKNYPTLGHQLAPLRDPAPLIALLKGEERASWLTLECTILRGVQSLNQLELEGESLFLSLSRIICDLLMPDLLELELETAADFWPGCPADWTWIDPKPGMEPTHVGLTPRLQRLLYRRDRVLYVEDFSAAPDIQIGGVSKNQPFKTGFLLPLISGVKPLGILRLFYDHELAPLPGDVEAIELLRRELSQLMERSRTHLRMQRMATVDGLTNLFNHRFFREQLRTEYQRALRYKKMMTMIMIDIDDFKVYNDTYGHLAGDRVLADTARTIRSSVRDIDYVARYGGEEFALILPEVDAQSGMIVAEKIRKAVEAQRFISEDGEVIGAITVSCGVTDNLDTSLPEDLIDRADRALYWVKRHGRNLVRLFAADDDD
jgi:diguanylate cyclase (GGDEF)-like protein